MHLKYGPIRVVALGGNGLIRGWLLNSHTCQIYHSLQNGLYLNVHLQYEAWIINPWRYQLMRMNSQSLKIWADRYEFSIFEGMGWEAWILNFWRYGPRGMNSHSMKVWATGMNSQSLKVWADRYEFSILKVPVNRYEFSIFEDVGRQVWILYIWRYGLTGMNTSIFEGMYWQVWILNFVGMAKQVGILNIWQVWRNYLDFFFKLKNVS